MKERFDRNGVTITYDSFGVCIYSKVCKKCGDTISAIVPTGVTYGLGFEHEEIESKLVCDCIRRPVVHESECPQPQKEKKKTFTDSDFYQKVVCKRKNRKR